MRPAAELRVIALAGLALLALAACGERGPVQKLVPGERLPAARLERLEGGGASSLSEFRGKALIVNFWATWCEPCRREMPDLERLAALARGRGAEVVGITVDSDLNLAREFVLRNKLSFPILVDRDMKFTGDALGIDAFPETFLVDAEGRLKARMKGAREWTSPDAVRALRAVLGVDLAPARTEEAKTGQRRNDGGNS